MLIMQYKQGNILFTNIPILYFKMNETGSSTLEDSSGNGYDGTIVGGLTFNVIKAANAPAGTAVSFNGSSQYVTADAAAPLIASTPNGEYINISMWLKSTAPGAFNWNNMALSFNASNTNAHGRFSISPSGGMFFDNASNNSSYGSNYDDGNWHHYAGSLQIGGSSHKLYADGVELAVTGIGNGNVSSVTRVTVGGEWDAGMSDYYDGEMDEMFIGRRSTPWSLSEAQSLAGI